MAANCVARAVLTAWEHATDAFATVQNSRLTHCIQATDLTTFFCCISPVRNAAVRKRARRLGILVQTRVFGAGVSRSAVSGIRKAKTITATSAAPPAARKAALYPK